MCGWGDREWCTSHPKESTGAIRGMPMIEDGLCRGVRCPHTRASLSPMRASHLTLLSTDVQRPILR